MKLLLSVFMPLVLFSHGAYSQYKLKEVNPIPNISFSSNGMTLAIALDDTISDEYTEADQGGVKSLKVDNWRKSINNGFENGFGHFFDLKSSDAQVTLVMHDAGLELIPTLADAEEQAILVKVYFDAEWVQSGESLGRLQEGVEAQSAVTSSQQLSKVVKQLLEGMFEKIAAQLK